jgi:type II secretory pathway component PulK
MRAARRPAPRRGLTAVAVLICLLIVTMISAALLKVGVAQRAQARAQERALQAEWLAQAGLDRALARLAAKADYGGETWEIAAAELRSGEPNSAEQGPAARVVINVQQAAGSPGQRLVKVQADFPPDHARRARHSTQLLVELGSLKTGDSR